LRVAQCWAWACIGGVEVVRIRVFVSWIAASHVRPKAKVRMRGATATATAAEFIGYTGYSGGGAAEAEGGG
jgi:hypothetical protein